MRRETLSKTLRQFGNVALHTWCTPGAHLVHNPVHTWCTTQCTPGAALKKELERLEELENQEKRRIKQEEKAKEKAKRRAEFEKKKSEEQKEESSQVCSEGDCFKLI